MTTSASKIVAVLDACVLYPPSLRDLLMRLAAAGVYEPRWTEEIHAEWTRNVLADYPDVTPMQLDRTRRLMNQAIPKGLVSGYEGRIPTFSLPDANDRHVLAAAIEASATVIVTFNLSDFPAATLAACGIEPLHPDAFLSALFDTETDLFLRGGAATPGLASQPAQDRRGLHTDAQSNRLEAACLACRRPSSRHLNTQAPGCGPVPSQFRR